MKRLFTGFLIFILISSYVFSVELSFSPFAGAVNVNLNAEEDWQKDRPIYSPTGENGQIFDNAQIVAHGEVRDIPRNAADSIQVTVSCSSSSYENGYYWFVSQSNPDSRRPFQLQLAGPTRYGNQDYWGKISYTGDVKVGYAEQLLANGTPLTITLNNKYFNWSDYSNDYYQIDFNIGIYLPGEINNGTLTFEDSEDPSELRGLSYTIMPGDDYSAELTVTITVDNVYPAPPPITYVIPFSGYYDPTKESGQTYSTEVSSSLSVNVLPAAAAIDLIEDQGKTLDIAEINYGIYNLGEAIVDDEVLLFLSASNNPFTGNDDGFRFVHETAIGNPLAVINSTNSLGYTITSVFNPDPAETETSVGNSTGVKPKDVTYDGTAWIDISSGEVYSANQAEAIKTVHHEQHHKQASILDPHWHTYRGLLQLNLDPLPSQIEAIQEGYYRSNVYIHVVVNDALYSSIGGV